MKKNVGRLSVIFISMVFMIQLSGCASVNKDFISGNISTETNSILITDNGVWLVELDGIKRVTKIGMQESMEVIPVNPGSHRIGLRFSNASYVSYDTLYIDNNCAKGKYYSIEGIVKMGRINYEIKEETNPATIEKVNKLLKE